MPYARFAIYYLPPLGPMADFGAAWLGWDVNAGRRADFWDVNGLKGITMTPRKYGFHGTLKPPFRLAVDTNQKMLEAAVARLALACAPARCEGLQVTALGRFLALTPVGDETGIARVAASCVTDLDRYRAPAKEVELAKRRAKGLSDRQDALLEQWGYPYVLDEFRFHMTLSGRMPKADLPNWMVLTKTCLPNLPTPFVMDEVALVGEREDGFFELIHRYALTG
ncbi:MAG: DUF1045 domain-containing protein [Pseudomonadota bacterium]